MTTKIKPARGLEANLPAASLANLWEVAYTTDTEKLLISNGVEWVQLNGTGGGGGSDPLKANKDLSNVTDEVLAAKIKSVGIDSIIEEYVDISYSSTRAVQDCGVAAAAATVIQGQSLLIAPTVPAGGVALPTNGYLLATQIGACIFNPTTLRAKYLPYTPDKELPFHFNSTETVTFPSDPNFFNNAVLSVPSVVDNTDNTRVMVGFRINDALNCAITSTDCKTFTLCNFDVPLAQHAALPTIFQHDTATGEMWLYMLPATDLSTADIYASTDGVNFSMIADDFPINFGILPASGISPRYNTATMFYDQATDILIYTPSGKLKLQSIIGKRVAGVWTVKQIPVYRDSGSCSFGGFSYNYEIGRYEAAIAHTTTLRTSFLELRPLDVWNAVAGWGATTPYTTATTVNSSEYTKFHSRFITPKLGGFFHNVDTGDLYGFAKVPTEINSATPPNPMKGMIPSTYSNIIPLSRTKNGSSYKLMVGWSTNSYLIMLPMIEAQVGKHYVLDNRCGAAVLAMPVFVMLPTVQNNFDRISLEMPFAAGLNICSYAAKGNGKMNCLIGNSTASQIAFTQGHSMFYTAAASHGIKLGWTSYKWDGLSTDMAQSSDIWALTI